jgi:hypothetical protein
VRNTFRSAGRLIREPRSARPRAAGGNRRLAICAAIALLAGLGVAAPASAAPVHQRIDLRVLVLSDGGTGVDTVVAQFDREGVPYDTVNLGQSGRSAITAASLADSVNGVRRAKYQAVVVPNENAISGAEATAVADFEREFGVRQLVAYTWANVAVGETTVWSGSLDGVNMTVTSAAKSAGFGYLGGTVPVDNRDPSVAESYGYLATANVPAGATLTPLVTATAPGGPSGALMAVYAHDGREELIVTLAANRNQTHAMVLGHGLVTWLTKGVHLGHWRNWLSVHVDDVFLPDDRWDTGANCTVGDDCNASRDPNVAPYNTLIRMRTDTDPTKDDVVTLVNWQKNRNFKLDLAFNGDGSVDAGTGDPLTAKLLANKTEFRWINHTYAHQYLSCVQDFTVSPWRCSTDANGQIVWVSQADITSQIRDNVNWAQNKGISLDPSEVVTGEHSGLKSSPQVPSDNPNLVPALNATGIKVLASDASREPGPRLVGPARTVPRHPTNIYYNVATKAEEVDEYNWIYTSQADGGSGICTANPATSTCIAPLSTANGFDSYIVPIESRIAFDHVVQCDPEPHYAHQSNLTEDRILYPVLDAVLARYRNTFTTATPVVNPRFSAIALVQKRQSDWRSAVAARTIEAYTLDGRVTVVNRGNAVDVPITVPTGSKTFSVNLLGIIQISGDYGEAYGGEQSAWTPVAHNGQQQLILP